MGHHRRCGGGGGGLLLLLWVAIVEIRWRRRMCRDGRGGVMIIMVVLRRCRFRRLNNDGKGLQCIFGIHDLTIG